MAAIATPVRSFPRYLATTSGLSHWSTKPLPNPATTIIGPKRTRYPRLYFAQSRTASIKSVAPRAGIRQADIRHRLEVVLISF